MFKRFSVLLAASAVISLGFSCPLLAAGPDLYGGKGLNNSYTLDADVAAKSVAGGINEANEAVSGNSLTIIKGAKTTGPVYGGYTTGTGAVSNNKVIMNNGAVANILGGHTTGAGAVNNNSVIMNDGTAANIFGGSSSGKGTVSNNSVTVNGGTATDVVGGYSNNGVSTGNFAIINNGKITGVVLGGESINNIASGNKVTINGGNVNDVVGGFSTNGLAHGNSVVINGGLVDGDVSGGESLNGTASSNIITVNGGVLKGFVVGGGGGSVAENNTVRITGAPDLSAATLVGGVAPQTYGNRLEIMGFSGQVRSIAQFQNYYFALPAAMGSNGVLLDLALPANLANSTIDRVDMLGGGAVLAPGEAVILMDSTTNAPLNSVVSGTKGVTLNYEFDVESANGQLAVRVRDVRANPRAKALSEGYLNGPIMLGQASDLFVGQVLNNVKSVSTQSGFTPLLGVSGSYSRYNTGSHVDAGGFSLLAGLGWNSAAKPGILSLGAFFEAGRGNYSSYNSFDNAPSVKGDGDTEYYGGGIFARYALDGKQGFYADASARGGQVKTGFSSEDLRDPLGLEASYDSSSAYYGAHAGLGYVWALSEKAELDFSTRYIWTRQNGDTVKVVGDPVKFDAIDSHRWRSGVRFSYAVNECFTPYAGAYYDHEFGGKAKASVYGYAIDAPDVTGGTGVGELGFSLRPSATSSFSADLGIHGYIGVREGVGGSLRLKWEF